jgi:hypothetical protein
VLLVVLDPIFRLLPLYYVNQLFSGDDTMFFFHLKKMWPWKLEKNTPKSRILNQNFRHFRNFPFLTWAAKTAQTAEFMFSNMAYRATVYKTGSEAVLWENQEKMQLSYLIKRFLSKLRTKLSLKRKKRI